MAERKSGRPRKNLDYAKIELDSDDEFFSGNPKSHKKSKKESDDEDWHEITTDDRREKVSTKSVRSKKNEKGSSKKSSSSATSACPKVQDKNLDDLKVNETSMFTSDLVCAVPLGSTEHSSLPGSSILKTPPALKTAGVIAHSAPLPCKLSQPHLGSPKISVTPSSGLRLGLSRNMKLRPLHSNIRIT